MWRTGLVAPWHVGSSWTRARTRVLCIGRRILNHCATWEVLFFFYFRFFFDVDHFLKVFIEFGYNIASVFFMFWFLWPRGMWDLSFPTRDRTCTPCIGRRSLSHWTAREVPAHYYFKSLFIDYFLREAFPQPPCQNSNLSSP